MGSILLFTRAFGRSLRPLLLLLMTAGLMSAFNPYILRYDVGFQLSFVAVAGLVYLAPVFDGWFPVPKHFIEARSMATATLAATIATLPLILYTFGNLAIYALPANMLILPVIPYAMAAGAFAGVLGMVSPGMALIGGIPAWALAWWQLHVISWFADLPFARMTISFPIIGLVVGYLLIALFLFRYAYHRENRTLT
jgi:competence protein ComEC